MEKERLVSKLNSENSYLKEQMETNLSKLEKSKENLEQEIEEEKFNTEKIKTDNNNLIINQKILEDKVVYLENELTQYKRSKAELEKTAITTK